MFCPKCGQQNDDAAYQCSNCFNALPRFDVPQRPLATRIDNNLVLSIVVTVLCCLPFGIVALIQAAQVNAKLAGGDVAGAEESSRKALKWSLWGMGISVIVWGLYFVVAVLSVMAGGAFP